MTIATTQYKEVYGTFGNRAEWHTVVYDYSVETATSGNFDLFIAGEDLVMLDYYLDVQTAVTSGGTLTLTLGTTDPSASTAIHSSVAVANLTLNSVKGMGTALPIAINHDGIMRMTIAGAAATAGKLAFNFLLKRR
jgi:hypothetical protein